MSVLPKTLFLVCAWLMFHATIVCADKEEVVLAKDTVVKFPLPNPSDIGAEKFSLLLNTFLTQNGYSAWQKDLHPRNTGPFTVHPSGLVENYGTHGSAAVKVAYSPQVWDWMQNGRKGLIPDGGMIIKLLYARNETDPTRFSAEPTGFSIMIKDSKGSWDGWFYSDGGPLLKPTRENAATFFDPNVGFALSCMNCHASADNPEGSFASIRNVKETPLIEHLTTVSPEGLKKRLIKVSDIHSVQELKPTEKRPLQPNSPYWDRSDKVAALNEPAPFPLAAFDHVPQGSRPHGQQAFITSSNCNSCHNAVQLNSTRPNMLAQEETKAGAKTLTNLSPSSEWRYSMMGLSGRDPVFFAQLESERALHPELADQIDDKCLSCHAVMGQRQWKKDHGEDSLFTHKSAQAEPESPHAKYGALARDSISCIVCHQMLPDGLGTPETYSGKFKLLDKPTKIFGPYEKAATLPMEQALGLTPQLGAHLKDSNLCASCHTVALPVLDVGKKYSAAEFKRLSDAQEHPKAFHEQATYLEWKNSSFSTEVPNPGPKQQSCQGCHMPKTYKNQRLRFRIANIEDDTFPAVDHRAGDAQLHMELRDSYSRHSLHGINIIMLEMFSQNPWLLGVTRKDNLSPDPDMKSGFDVARESLLKMAQEQTATVKILGAKREGKLLKAQIEITNLTGHKFPTGVNFRRAFLEVKVMKGDKILWISGATDKWGVIGNLNKEKFVPLKSEFFTDRAFQPHYGKIEREDQVQIYEELVADSDGAFTTSFLGLKTVIKDNRLLPHGWKLDGPDVDLIRPAGAAEDKDYQSGLGKDLVTYEIPIEVGDGRDLAVTATLFYQSLPPYYLKRRFEHIDRPATQRLFYLVNQLDLESTEARDWKLKISQDQSQVK